MSNAETPVPPDDAALLSGRIADGVHHIHQRVYYEDTDAAGIVYYANYLCFAERARTEILRLLGVSQARLRAEEGLAFAVRRCAVTYHRPARLDDLLIIRTWVTAMTRVQVTMRQAVAGAADGRAIAELDVQIVCIDDDGRPARIPQALTGAFTHLMTHAE